MKGLTKHILLLFICLPCMIFSQQEVTIDSLIATSKILYKTNVDSAQIYAERAYDMAIKGSDTQQIAKASINKSFYHFRKDESSEVEETLSFILENQDKVHPQFVGQAYNHLGGIYYREKGIEDALRMYFKAIDFHEQAGNHAGQARTYLNLGMMYGSLENEDLANYFYEKSKYHAALGENPSAVHDLEQKEEYYSLQKQIEMSENALAKIDDKRNSVLAAEIYGDLARTYLENKEFRKAAVSGNAAIDIMNRINFKNTLHLSQFYVGSAYLGLGEYDLAKSYLKQAIETTKNLKLKTRFFETLIRAYEDSGDFRGAVREQAIYITLKDSINSIQENDRIAEITAQFETEKQAQEIEILEGDNKLQASKLKNQRNILFATIAGVVLLLTVLFFAYKAHKIKRNLQFSELTQKLLLMQLNPHFLFNALNGIQYFIKKNDTKKSTRYISNFSGLMRNILENSVEKFISIEEDFKTISDFLALQQLVHNNSFKYTVTVSEDIDETNTAIPPMFTQPFVENAIIHGVVGLSEGKIEVMYSLKNEKEIEVVIKDNGKGINSSKESANSLHKSMGTSITNQRIENLLKAENYPISLQVVSNNEGEGIQGTKIVLTFPMKYI